MSTAQENNVNQEEKKSQKIQTKKESDEFHFNESKIDLIKRTICKEATGDELELFIHTCEKRMLDPLLRQIFPVMRWNKSLNRNAMTIQTAIDGYRLIADRTGKYAPGNKNEFGYDNDGQLKWAKAYIKKMTDDGIWHEISSIAFWDEYVQTTKDGKPTIFWKKKGHIMLSKCAEALALRKAFPAELSGIYTQEEMEQEMSAPVQPSTISKAQLELLANELEDEKDLLENVLKGFSILKLAELPQSKYLKCMNRIREIKHTREEKDHAAS